MKILALDRVSLWGADELPGVHTLQWQKPAGADIAQGGNLSEPAQAGYLKLLNQRREPLFLTELSLHPCLRELSGLEPMQGASSQIEACA